MKEMLFTPLSAQTILKRIRPAAESMCRLVRRMKEIRPTGGDSDQAVDRTYFRLLLELHRNIIFVRDEGVLVHGSELGTIDFPAKRGGSDVVLCWRVGEPEPCHWHGVGEDHSNRMPVDHADRWDGEAE